MLATVLHAPGDVRFEDVAEPKIEKPTDAIIKLVGDLRLRLRPLALPRLAAARRPDAHGPRILRRGGRGRQRRQVGEARPVRRRLLLHLRQHLSALPPRLSVLLRAARVHVRRPGASRARAAGRRHPGRDGDHAGRGPDPEPAGGLGRARHRLVRGGRRAGHAGNDGRRRGRRRRRPDGRPRREADGRGADHRHEPTQDAAGSGAGIRRDRHRLRARRRRRGADQGAYATCRRPTPCSNASAPRNR